MHHVKLCRIWIFPELTVEDVKLKVHAVRTRYTAELAKIIKSEQCDAALHGICEPNVFCFKRAHSFLLSVCIPRTSLSTKVLYVSNFSIFTN
jgi:hypothetical protein